MKFKDGSKWTNPLSKQWHEDTAKHKSNCPKSFCSESCEIIQIQKNPPYAKDRNKSKLPPELESTIAELKRQIEIECDCKFGEKDGWRKKNKIGSWGHLHCSNYDCVWESAWVSCFTNKHKKEKENSQKWRNRILWISLALLLFAAFLLSYPKLVKNWKTAAYYELLILLFVSLFIPIILYSVTSELGKKYEVVSKHKTKIKKKRVK